MAKQTFKSLTKAEEQIMQTLWKIGNGTTHDIIEALPLPKPHYNTVSTVMKILIEKGFVTAKAIGKTNIYHPLVAQEVYSKNAVKRLMQQYFGGSFANLLSAFSKDKDMDLKELESIIKEMKK